MSELRIYRHDEAHHNRSFDELIDLQEHLGEYGVRFERWEATAKLEENATQANILEAYKDSIAKLKEECGFTTVDVVAMKPDHPDKAALRTKFLSEHTHSEDEVRFFVEGSGLFYMHFDEWVYGVLCRAGDLISVPAGTKHWFDMGSSPDFKCIRLFCDPAGWVAEYTGDKIANGFPHHGT